MSERVELGHYVEVVEGSWVGLTGLVTELVDERHVVVTDQRGCQWTVVACTLTRLDG